MQLGMVKKIISGGQTGADQAGLDIAIEKGLSHGGYIPKGRRTETGILPEKYHLIEMATTSYPKRTEKNILESDGTVIFTYGPLTSGSALTQKLSESHDRPWAHIDLNIIKASQAAGILKDWIEKNNIETLNVAGSRASKAPGIHFRVYIILDLVIT